MAGPNDRSDGDVAEAVRFQRDLYLYWRAIAALRGVPLTARGFVARPALRRLRVRLAVVDGRSADAEHDLPEGQDLRLFFMRRLAQRLGLLTTAESRLIVSEREKIECFLSYALAERLRICLRVWVAGGWWPDAPDPATTPPRLLTPAPPRLALARRRLLDRLADLSPGENLLAPLVQPTPVRRRARRVSASRRTQESRRDMLATDTESPSIQAALDGPLTWMGMVTPAMPAEPASTLSPAYTVTPAVAALRQDAAAAGLEETPGRVVAQPSFELVAFPPLVAPALLLLDTCAQEDALGQAARYRLTRESFAQAHQWGWSARDIASRLEALTSAPLPANVRVTLRDWERQSERLHLTENATVLTVHAPAVLEALLADPGAAGWIARRLAPTAALLAPAHVAHVRAWLLRHGELPAIAGPQE